MATMTSILRSGSLTARVWPTSASDPRPTPSISTVPLTRPSTNARIAPLRGLHGEREAGGQAGLRAPEAVPRRLRDVEAGAVELDAARALRRVADVGRRTELLAERRDERVHARRHAGPDVVHAGPSSRER